MSKVGLKISQMLRRSTATFFTEQNANGSYLGLSNDILCILAAQWAAKLGVLKFRVLKKLLALEKRADFT